MSARTFAPSLDTNCFNDGQDSLSQGVCHYVTLHVLPRQFTERNNALVHLCLRIGQYGSVKIVVETSAADNVIVGGICLKLVSSVRSGIYARRSLTLDSQILEEIAQASQALDTRFTDTRND